MNSKRTQDLLQADLDHIIHPFGIVGENMGIVMEEAHDIYVVDTNGREYVDLSSQLVCCNLGHRRPELIDAMTRAAKKVDYVTSFYGFSNPYLIEVGQKLAKLTPSNINHFFFTSGGSESIDTAVKLARFYWSNTGLAGKYKIMSLYGSYHGQAGMSTQATGLGRGSFHNPYGPVLPGFIKVPSYYSYHCMFGDVQDCGRIGIKLLEEIIGAEGPESIAAFIAEPIIGTGGQIVPPPYWWPSVIDILKKNDILLITDEVMTGFTRTGKFFACEHWNIKPDIMTMAKGVTNAALPYGVVGISDKVYDVMKGKTFTHGFSYSGHAIPSAVASATLDIYVKDAVVDNAAKVGAHIKQRLEKEFLPLPCVGDVDGLGVFQAIELVQDKESKAPLDANVKAKLWKDLLNSGIFTRITGWMGNRMQICPPCVITMEEANKALDMLYPVLATLQPE